MSMRERMTKGQLFTDMCEGLPEERLRGKELMHDFNNTRPSEEARRISLLKEMFGKVGKNPWIEPPVHFAYGSHISVGDNFYANFNLTIIDDCQVTFGNDVFIGPNVTITVTGHPIDAELRNTGQKYAFPVTIGNNVWIGSRAVINPGVTIGDNSVIGSGSVVTRDIPANVVAAGVPCKVLRPVGDRDKEFYFRERTIAEGKL